jgi:dTDP-4-amino-4,6-dideoxygalactose transaminase
MVGEAASSPTAAGRPGPRARFLPSEPTLSPGLLVPWGKHPAPVFPFTASRSQWYYFARNAVWHGIRLLGLREGDEVLVPAYNHGVEVGAILATGVSVKFFRVTPGLEIDFDDLRARISSRSKALLVIYYLGFPQPLDEITAFCREHDLSLIEDCAQSLFSTSGGRPLGSVGAFSVFCLYKTLPLPHGGLLVLNDPLLGLPEKPQPPRLASAVRGVPQRLLDRMEMKGRALVRWPRRSLRAPLRILMRRMPGGDISTALEDFDIGMVNLGASGLAQRLAGKADAQTIVSARRRNFEALMALVPKSRQLIHHLPEGVCPLFFPVLVEDKKAAIQILAEAGIEAIPFWSLPHASIPREEFPDADYLRTHVLEVPVHQALSPEDMDYLAQALTRVPVPAGAH